MAPNYFLLVVSDQNYLPEDIRAAQYFKHPLFFHHIHERCHFPTVSLSRLQQNDGAIIAVLGVT